MSDTACKARCADLPVEQIAPLLRRAVIDQDPNPFGWTPGAPTRRDQRVAELMRDMENDLHNLRHTSYLAAFFSNNTPKAKAEAGADGVVNFLINDLRDRAEAVFDRWSAAVYLEDDADMNVAPTIHDSEHQDASLLELGRGLREAWESDTGRRGSAEASQIASRIEQHPATSLTGLRTKALALSCTPDGDRLDLKALAVDPQAPRFERLAASVALDLLALGEPSDIDGGLLALQPLWAKIHQDFITAEALRNRLDDRCIDVYPVNESPDRQAIIDTIDDREGLTAAQALVKRLVAAQRNIAETALEMPARSLAGLRVKAQMSKDWPDREELARSIMDDILAMEM